ncbi:MAG: response regulator transcription factor [Comamonadaceae bacterium]|nr:MAG: response regulator transcription factor [Comamonadaceae bacterium]
MDKTVLVVDDHPLFRKALVSLVEETEACSSVFAAASAEDGLARLREGKVDLTLLDLGLPGAAGVDAIALFRRASDAPILVVSASEHRQEVAAATRAGASAVVSKSVSMDTLKDIVKQALLGSLPDQKWVRPAGSLSIGEESGRGLTPRQQEIATLLMDGHSNKEIGMRLNLAEITVKTHLTAIFRVLGVVNRTQAVVAIRRLGLDYGPA